MVGLRVELEIESPTGCPVVAAADAADTEATGVTWSEAGDGTVEQFELSGAGSGAGSGDEGPSPTPDGGTATDGGAAAVASATADTDVRPVFDHEDGTVYEFEREPGPCACQRLEAAGHPIADVSATDGALQVTLHLEEDEPVGALLAELEDTADAVRIRSVARSSPAAEQPEEIVAVDRGRLTDRQREVVETAYAKGYFEYPRGANASEVAETLDICPSTFAEHLAAAQTKLFADVLDGGVTSDSGGA